MFARGRVSMLSVELERYCGKPAKTGSVALQEINTPLQYSPRAGTFSPQLISSETFLQCSSENDAFKQIMDKLQGVVPMKAATTAAALKPVHRSRPAKLSDEESKEISIVRKSLTTKGVQTLPSGAVPFDLTGVSRLIKE